MVFTECVMTEGVVTVESENGSSPKAEAEVAAPARAVPADPAPANAVTTSSSSETDSSENISAVSGNLELLSGVELPVTLCFGRRRMRLREVLDLNAGSVVELDRLVEEPVELLLHGRVIARGDVVVVDGNYGLRVLEVVRASGGVNA